MMGPKSEILERLFVYKNEDFGLITLLRNIYFLFMLFLALSILLSSIGEIYSGVLAFVSLLIAGLYWTPIFQNKFLQEHSNWLKGGLFLVAIIPVINLFIIGPLIGFKVLSKVSSKLNKEKEVQSKFEEEKEGVKKKMEKKNPKKAAIMSLFVPCSGLLYANWKKYGLLSVLYDLLILILIFIVPGGISALITIILWLFQVSLGYEAVKTRIKQKKKVRRWKEKLSELKEFISQGHEPSESEGAEKEYVTIFRKATEAFNKGNYDSLPDLTERARELKKSEKKVRDSLEEINNKINLGEEHSVLRKKYERAKESLESGKYDKAEKLIDEFWLGKEAKEKIEKIKDYYNETKNETIKEILNESKKKFSRGNFNRIDKLHEEAYKKRQKERGLKKFEGEWLKPEKIKEIKSARVGLSNNFQDYSPYEFEDFIAELFEKMGYSIRVTRKSRDYGIDVVAEKDDETLGVQVKRNSESNPVGAKTVQNTLGSKYKIGADHTILVTTSYFTVTAREQAKEAPIELWDKNKLHKMVKKYFIDR